MLVFDSTLHEIRHGCTMCKMQKLRHSGNPGIFCQILSMHPVSEKSEQLIWSSKFSPIQTHSICIASMHACAMRKWASSVCMAQSKSIAQHIISLLLGKVSLSYLKIPITMATSAPTNHLSGFLLGWRRFGFLCCRSCPINSPDRLILHCIGACLRNAKCNLLIGPQGRIDRCCLLHALLRT